MKSVRLLVFLFAITLSFLSAAIVTREVTARAATPDRLEILRTTGYNGHTAAHEMVTQIRPVQDLYTAMLSLPPAPADQICPQYIIANYQLTFFSRNTVVQKANALRGECQPVTLNSRDIRTANAKFWALVSKVVDVGKAISTPTKTPNPSPTATSALTPTPISTPGGHNLPSSGHK